MQRELISGFVLHRRPYRDTSALVDVFTREHGRITVVARGVQSARSAWRGLLQPFRPLWLAWSGRGELFTLTQAEAAGPQIWLTGSLALSGLYLNELVMKLLARDDPYPVLFERYSQTLTALTEDHERLHEATVLRLFERDLLQELGTGLVLDHDVSSGAPVEPETLYCYMAEQGPVAVLPAAHSEPGCNVHGSTLLALQQGELTGDRTMREGKQLMRVVLDHHLGHRSMASRKLRRALEDVAIR